MQRCTISTEYQRRGIDLLVLENSHLRVEVLVGKGGDITEIRDKRTDTNVLFEAPHEWQSPTAGYTTPGDDVFSFMDHYPGGWQDVLPAAGGPTTVAGAPFPLHGESPLAPWDIRVIEDSKHRVAATLSLSLTRYPLTIERTLSLSAGESKLDVDEVVTNVGEYPVEYSWLQHIALGEPLVGPAAELDVPCTTVLTDPNHDVATARFPTNESYEWPICELPDGIEVDLRTIPPKSDRVHDLVALTDLRDGRYTLSNPDIDLGVTVRFPSETFEYLWYWQPLGGFDDAPFFGRNYNVGLEPCTSIPNAGLKQAINNNTANVLTPDETETATIRFETHPA